MQNPSQPSPNLCSVVELRQYTLHRDQRDVLIELFEREFVESQQALGICLLGLFRDLDDADRFVWLRGFRDMTERGEALHAFYSGPAWQQHRAAANATMLDSDNVLLLRPAGSVPACAVGTGRRAETDGARGIVVATLHYFEHAVDAATVDGLNRALAESPGLGDGDLIAAFVTEAAANNFPRLPVREGEHVFIWLARFADESTYSAHAHAHALAATDALASLRPRIVRSETLRLLPTARSPWPLTATRG